MPSFDLIIDEFQALMNEGGIVLCGILVIGVWVYTMLFSTWSGLLKFENELDQGIQTDGDSKRSIARQFTVFELDRLAWVERRSPVIGVMIGICTLGGLLGTVSGMLVTFSSLSSISSAPPMEKIAVGISEALVTTQAGLLMAIPAAFLYALLLRRIKILKGRTEREMYSVMRDCMVKGEAQ